MSALQKRRRLGEKLEIDDVSDFLSSGLTMMTLMMMRRIMKNRIAMIFQFGLKTEIIAESLTGVRQTQTSLID